MIKRLTFCLFLLINLQLLKAQTTDNIVGQAITTPPNAAVFTQYAKVPVGEFTGIPDIKVPLYDIKVDNFHMPVYLSYYARGIQPNVHAGWVGTGWNLIANGVINRKINGFPDEFKYDYVSGAVTKDGSDDIGWYYASNRSRLLAANWNTLNNVASYQGDIFVPTTATKPDTVTDCSPDEFDFSINGLTGAFFMGEDGNWKVRSSGGETVRVQETMGNVGIVCLQTPVPGRGAIIFNNKQTITGTFVQFVLTTGDGTRYIFGGGPNSTTQNTSIDFNRIGQYQGTYNESMIAMAWHITEIDLPSGKKIQFNYFRDGTQFVFNPTASASYAANAYKSSGGNWFSNLLSGDLSYSGSTFSAVYDPGVGNAPPIEFNMNIMDPVYLQSITFPEGRLTFNSSRSGELDNLETGASFSLQQISNDIGAGNTTNSPHPPGVLNAFLMFRSYTDIFNNYAPFTASGNPNSIWYQLNYIELDDYNGNRLKDFNLNYTEDSNTRLFLQSVQETDYYNNSYGSTLPPYTFSYSATPLPAYCTEHTDHWGFYNGTAAANPYPTFSYDVNGFPTTATLNSYFQFREPNPNFVQAGILTQINYPTGGYSQFTYEPNTYRKRVSGIPIQVATLPVDSIGGGVRIKQIVSTDNANLTPITYQYNYVNDLVNNVSSGVLGMPRPVYQDIGPTLTFKTSGTGGSRVLIINTIYKFWNINTIYPSQNDDGNIVTYSNVIERQSNNGVYNGMKVSVFTNHDNGYANVNPDVSVWSVMSGLDLYQYNDCAFQRGMLLSETTYDQNNNIVKKVQNTYNSDTTLYVKSIYSTTRQVNMTISSFYNQGDVLITFIRNSAVRNYTFYPSLKQSIVTDYPSDGSGNFVTTTTNYTYDPKWDGFNGTKNLVQTREIDAKGQTTISNTKYALDYTISGITTANVTNSDAFTQGIFNLQSLYTVAEPVENTTQFTDIYGNLKTKTAFLNTFDTHLPFPALTYRAAIIKPQNTFTPSSITVNNLVGALSKDATYEPRTAIDKFDALGNVLQEHTIGGATTVYLYGYNSQYMVAKIINSTYTAVQQAMTQNSITQAQLDNSALAGDVVTRGLLNTLRNALPGSLVSSYTYAPLIGMTSSTDAKGEITYYQYDTFQRLMNQLDNNGNIVKHIDYHYANQPLPANSSSISVIASNSTNTPWNIAISNNTPGAEPQNATITPGSSTLFTNLIAGTYNCAITPSGQPNSAVANLLFNGTTYSGTSFNFSNIPVTSTVNFAVSAYSATPTYYPFTMTSGFTSYANELGSYGSKLGYIYLLFGATSTFNPGTAVLIGTLGGGKPSVTQTIPFSYHGVSWTITIQTGGQVYLTLSPAATAGVTGQITTGATFYYNL